MLATDFRGFRLNIDAKPIPGSPGSFTEPPSRDSFEFGDITFRGVPVALTAAQIDELEDQLLLDGRSVRKPQCKIAATVGLALAAMANPDNSLLGYFAADSLAGLTERYEMIV